MKRIILLLIVMAVFTGCLGGGQDTSSHEEGAREVIITLSNYQFTPNIIEAQAGERILLKVENIEGVHNLFIPEYKVETNILVKGESQSILFEADKPGSFDFWCEVGNHKALGMVGKLIVSG